MTALLRKELRELTGVAAVALAAYVAVVAGLTGSRALAWVPGLRRDAAQVPFVDDAFPTAFALVTTALAVALGLRQTLGEAVQGTWQLLLHRPATRDAVVLTKLAAGAGVLAGCAAVPVLAYGAWAATPGTHASPFAWSMTAPAWKCVVVSELVYLAAFLTGLRPAWWFGSRLLPLAAAAMPVFVLQIGTPWWSVGLPATAAVVALLVVAVAAVAGRRDYA